jgi:hypothetical protein
MAYPEESFAVLVRGCDERGLKELFKWKQLNEEKVVLVGLGCPDELAKAFQTLTVITNNHYRGAELANSLELKCLLTGQKQPVPEGLLRAYPQLARIAPDK